eukprot:scaffold177399_cov27-Tisochrysis_lutea.AAC.3
MEPPMSVPSPKGEPNAAISAASPPDEPPGVRDLSQGLSATPQNENVSGAMRSCGTAVRMNGIAPACRRSLTKVASS